jgi:hypothetical protein
MADALTSGVSAPSAHLPPRCTQVNGRLLLRAYGRLIAVTAPDEILELTRGLLPPNYRPGRGEPERSWSVTDDGSDALLIAANGELLGLRRDAWSATAVLVSDLELWIAENAEPFIFVHAGCVGVDGRAVVLPGYSMSGKSTLTAALISAGAEYLSDEYAVVDRRGYVHSYARPLSQRLLPGLPAQRVSPSSLGARIAKDPVRLAMIATLRYEPTVHDFAPQLVTRGQGILDLLANTVPAQSRPVEALNALQRATADAIAVRGVRGDADQAAAALLKMLVDTAPSTAL